MGPNAVLHSALSVGNKTPKIAPFPLRFHHPAGGGPSHGHRQHAQKIIEDRDSRFGDILVNRQTHRQTHRHAHCNTLQPLPQVK